jgi:hypothetical protein
VDLSDRRVAQRLAPVRAAPVVALVRQRGPVAELLPVGAVVPAAPHLGIERVQDVSVEVANLALADEWPDVLVHVLAVARDGASAALVLDQPGSLRPSRTGVW